MLKALSPIGKVVLAVLIAAIVVIILFAVTNYMERTTVPPATSHSVGPAVSFEPGAKYLECIDREMRIRPACRQVLEVCGE